MMFQMFHVRGCLPVPPWGANTSAPGKEPYGNLLGKHGVFRRIGSEYRWMFFSDLDRPIPPQKQLLSKHAWAFLGPYLPCRNWHAPGVGFGGGGICSIYSQLPKKQIPPKKTKTSLVLSAGPAVGDLKRGTAPEKAVHNRRFGGFGRTSDIAWFMNSR